MTRTSALALSCLGGVVAAQLAWAADALADPKKQNVHAANVIAEVPIDKVTHPTWCYRRDPAIAFGQGRSLFLSDITGRIIRRTEVAYTIRAVFCSVDAKIIYAISPKTDHLTIYDAETGEQSEYSLAPPRLFFQGPNSLMSPDGSAFVLPSRPVLLSGPDILSKKTIIETDKPNAYWTKNVLFMPDIERNSYRLRRVGDFADLGLLKRAPDRVVQGIFGCGGSYFVLYWVDERQQRLLVRIDDKRLRGKATREATREYDNVGVVDQFSGTCTISFLRDVSSVAEVESALLLRDDTQELVDLHDGKFLAYWLSGSKDGRLLLGKKFLPQPGAPATGDTPSHIVVVRIEK